LDSTEVTTKKALFGSETAKVAFVDEVEGLVHLFDGSTAGVIWRRRVHKGMQSWLDTIPVDHLPTGRIILPASKVRSAVIELMNISEMPNCAERQLLLDDICLLAHEFNKLFASSYLRLRFDIVTTNKCPKFHIDHVAARLLCTYRGVGTEYSFLDDQRRPTEIFPTPDRAVIVLRGTKWPTVCVNNLAHRSPEIYGENETRLLLVIDLVDDAANEDL
tara:strand:+ start:171 stop:824 length:654 start_codon:yes stop_codon:yes gene_type:complete